MELHLVTDWDVSLEAPVAGRDPAGRFVGRDHEVALLCNELLRGSQRSIFVSGYRGVGKTALVYKVLHNVIDRAPGRFLPVLLNGTQLEASAATAPAGDHRSILVNLISRLYTAAGQVKLTSTLQDEVAELYEKAIAAEFSVGRTSVQASLDVSERQREIRLGISGWQGLLFAGSFTISLLLEAFGGLSKSFPAQAIPILIAGPLPFAISFGVEYVRSRTTTMSAQSTAEQSYAFDASIGNLEFDLEALHRKLADSGTTVLYVIDELDKIEAPTVINLLKYFKNLFMLSGAIFLFIGGEELARTFGIRNRSVEDGDDAYRPPEYTYFSAKYFLSRPDWRDVAHHMRDIVQVPGPLTEEDHLLLEKFTRLLTFEAAVDFFDLRRSIRDRISRFDDLTPIIELYDLTSREEVRVAIQTVLEVVFDEKYRLHAPSNWGENEEILRSLYEFAHRVADSYVGQAIEAERGDDLASAAKRDSCTLLHRIGLVEIASTEIAEIKGLDVEVSSYTYSGVLSGDVPRGIDFKSELERRFLAQYGDFIDLMRRILNVDRTLQGEQPIKLASRPDLFLRNNSPRLNELGLDFRSETEEARETYRALTRYRPPLSYSREQIEQVTEQVRTQKGVAEQNSHAAVAAAIEKGLDDVAPVSAPEAHALSDSSILSTLDELSTPYVILGRTNRERTLVVCGPIANDAIRRHRAVIRSLSSTARILIVGRSERNLGSKPQGLRAFDWNDGEASISATIKAVSKWLAS